MKRPGTGRQGMGRLGMERLAMKRLGMQRLATAIVLSGFTVLCVAQTGPAAQARPNFSGTWKLNLTKSDLGRMAPTSETDTITQTADEFKVEAVSVTERGNRDTTYSVKLDGTDTPNPPTADSPFQIVSSKAEWQGASLVVTQTTSFQDSKGTLTSTYTLSADGKTLTKATHIVFSQGAFDSKAVYDKA